MAINWWIKR